MGLFDKVKQIIQPSRIPKNIEDALRQSNIPYKVSHHRVAYTAQEIAAASHVPGKQFAKSVIVKATQGPRLIVLSATLRVDLKKLKTLLKAKSLSMAKEKDIEKLFPQMEIGAMPPFGGLYDVPVFIDKPLSECDLIVFNAGTHTDLITMRTRDYMGWVKPRVANLSEVPQHKSARARKPARKLETKA